MTKVEYFILEESVYHPGKYSIALNFDNFPSQLRTTGSFNILAARLFNLSYAQYLRFCRDMVGGELVGKNSIYPGVVFNKTMKVNALVRLLNSRMNLVVWEREHPDWREHQEYLAQKEGVKNVPNA
jgi:hypothetical protein